MANASENFYPFRSLLPGELVADLVWVRGSISGRHVTWADTICPHLGSGSPRTTARSMPSRLTSAASISAGIANNIERREIRNGETNGEPRPHRRVPSIGYSSPLKMSTKGRHLPSACLRITVTYLPSAVSSPPSSTIVVMVYAPYE